MTDERDDLYANWPDELKEAALRFARGYQVWMVYSREPEEYEAAADGLLAAIQNYAQKHPR